MRPPLPQARRDDGKGVARALLCIGQGEDCSGPPLTQAIEDHGKRVARAIRCIGQGPNFWGRSLTRAIEDFGEGLRCIGQGKARSGPPLTVAFENWGKSASHWDLWSVQTLLPFGEFQESACVDTHMWGNASLGNQHVCCEGAGTSRTLSLSLMLGGLGCMVSDVPTGVLCGATVIFLCNLVRTPL